MTLLPSLRAALVLLLLFTGLTGLAYPLTVLGLGQALFPHQAGGSLIVEQGQVRGSPLIGQRFTLPGYFHPRPSMAGSGYDASASAGSNLAPTAQTLVNRVSTDIAALRQQGVREAIPADLVTTSASGLDPHLSPDAALIQVNRVAQARNLPVATVEALVKAHITPPLLGLLGEYRVNVLELNRQLDALALHSTP